MGKKKIQPGPREKLIEKLTDSATVLRSIGSLASFEFADFGQAKCPEEIGERTEDGRVIVYGRFLTGDNSSQQRHFEDAFGGKLLRYNPGNETLSVVPEGDAFVVLLNEVAHHDNLAGAHLSELLTALRKQRDQTLARGTALEVLPESAAAVMGQ